MAQKYNAIKLNEKDNVAVALINLKPGDTLSIQGEREGIEVKGSIPYGHKIALFHLEKEQRVIKYGESIGMTTEEILPGHHVHTSNVRGLKTEERFSSNEEQTYSE